MKAAVTIYLVLATLAGPWLCCCTAAQVAPRPSAADQPSASCCCAPEAAEPLSEQSPVVPHKPCSCNDETLPAVVAAPVDSTVLLPAEDRLQIDGAGGTDDGVLTPRTAPQSPCSAFPLDSRDILRLLHILRC
jgi:hypothetical protein